LAQNAAKVGKEPKDEAAAAAMAIVAGVVR
jgi:UPF0716 family protein affecting phage T7 exclusion